MEYKLERSKRRSLTISIKNGEVIVKAPMDMPTAHIENFIAEKSKWITRKLADYEKKANALGDITSGADILYHGEFYEIVRMKECVRGKLADGVFYLSDKHIARADADKAIASYLKRAAKTELKAKLDEVSCAVGLPYNEFALTNARTQWGSCDGKNNIRLNWRLVMLDREIVTYVIVHELSHTLHHDHGAEFWRTVEKFMPNYKTVKNRLKSFSVLTGMYR